MAVTSNSAIRAPSLFAIKNVYIGKRESRIAIRSPPGKVLKPALAKVTEIAMNRVIAGSRAHILLWRGGDQRRSNSTLQPFTCNCVSGKRYSLGRQELRQSTRVQGRFVLLIPRVYRVIRSSRVTSSDAW